MQFIVIRGIPIDETYSPYVETYKEPLYNPVPKIYAKNNWPETTNMPCYMCTIVTKRIPFFVPAAIGASGEIYRGEHPIVCSPQCGMSWILEKAADECEKRKYISYMLELLRQITGFTVKVIEPAADKITLQKYGGDLTEHDYQADLISSSGDYMKNLYSDLNYYFADTS